MVIAPHIASVSVTAVRALRQGAISRAVAAALGHLPDNVVNQITSPRFVE
jgi:lactate dehydrogenase-like 2-hydroxyacid dehydrogenase